MRQFRTAIVLLSLLGMTQALEISSLSSWISSLINPSKIRQFIHDLEHPWIKEHKNWLETRETALYDLCDLDSQLRKEGINGRVYPADLFSRLDIDNNRYGIDRAGWKNARGRLKEMKDCPAALNDVRYLHVDIFIYGGSKYFGKGESRHPGDEIPQLFVDTLGAMPNLKRLDWGIPSSSTRVFEEAFVQRNLSLPSVTHLVPGAFSHYLVAMCPNLEKLEAGSYKNRWSWNSYAGPQTDDPAELLLAATTLVPTITTLSYYNRNMWDRDFVRRVLQATPNLVDLTIAGALEGNSGQFSLSRYEGTGGKVLKEILDELKNASKLDRLSLPGASGLDLGFDGGAGCGNAYMGPGGRAYRRQVQREDAEITEKAGDMVFAVLPYLNHLRVGWASPNITRIDHGEVSLVWPWTGGMEEWLYENWPDEQWPELEHGEL